jgi:hypothetical protein
MEYRQLSCRTDKFGNTINTHSYDISKPIPLVPTANVVEINDGISILEKNQNLKRTIIKDRETYILYVERGQYFYDVYALKKIHLVNIPKGYFF